MSVLVSEQIFTPEALAALPDSDRYELVDGHLVEKGMGAKASKVASELNRVVANYVKAQQLGHIFDGECGYQIFTVRANRVRKPDVSFVARGRFPNEEVPEGHIQIRPDWVAEVISPNDTVYEHEEKLEDYFGAQIPLIWVVYPNTERVMVYRADGTVSRLGNGDQLDGKSVLPGFTCPVADLFRS